MILLLSIVLGFMFGSFANVCISRLPKDESLWWPRSHCPHCEKPIRFRDNIPVLSFLWLRGRCYSCRQPISWQYPLVELAMASLFLLSALRYTFSIPQMVIFDLLAFYLLTISIIDYHHKIIPDELSLSLILIGWAVSFRNPFLISTLPHWAESLTASVAGGGVMLFFAWLGEKIFKKEALGGGDIKLMAGIGAILGGPGLIGALTLGSFIGAIWGGALLALKRKQPGETIPYGPFLCLGAFITALYPGWWTPFLSP